MTWDPAPFRAAISSTHETFVEHVATSAMPTEFGDFRAVAYRSRSN